jgi:hypothetical protein
MPWLQRLLESAQDWPPFVVVGGLLLFALIALQIILYINSIMMFWFRMVRNTLLLGAAVVIGSVVYQRGLEKTGLELQEIWQKVGVIWLDQYQHYQNNAHPPPKAFVQQAYEYVFPS